MDVLCKFADGHSASKMHGTVVKDGPFTATIKTEQDGCDHAVWLVINGGGFPSQTIVNANPDQEGEYGVSFSAEDSDGNYIDELTFSLEMNWSGDLFRDIELFESLVGIFLEQLNESAWLNNQRVKTDEPITNLEQAKALIKSLHDNRLMFHFDDGAVDSLADCGLVSLPKAREIDRRLDEAYKQDFGRFECPIGYALHLRGQS